MTNLTTVKTELRHDLSANLLSEIRALAELNGLTRLILFGSRARGDHKRTSDIDLAAEGGNVAKFSIDVEEDTNTLLRFDCVNMDGPINQDLRNSINAEGVVIYEKD